MSAGWNDGPGWEDLRLDACSVDAGRAEPVLRPPTTRPILTPPTPPDAATLALQIIDQARRELGRVLSPFIG